MEDVVVSIPEEIIHEAVVAEGHQVPATSALPPTIIAPPPPVTRSTSTESIGSSSSGEIDAQQFLAYRPKIKKQRRRKRDRMTFTFWLPLMICEFLPLFPPSFEIGFAQSLLLFCFVVVVALVCFHYFAGSGFSRETLQSFIGFEMNAV